MKTLDFERRRLFFKLEHEMKPEMLTDFILHYVKKIVFRPLLVMACISSTKEPELWEPEAIWTIYIGTFDLKSERDIAVSFFHELIHIMFYAVGMENRGDEENEVERVAKALANKYPKALSIIESICPKLSFAALAAKPELEQSIFWLSP